MSWCRHYITGLEKFMDCVQLPRYVEARKTLVITHLSSAWRGMTICALGDGLTILKQSRIEAHT
jgi:hypothetical protein